MLCFRLLATQFQLGVSGQTDIQMVNTGQSSIHSDQVPTFISEADCDLLVRFLVAVPRTSCPTWS